MTLQKKSLLLVFVPLPKGRILLYQIGRKSSLFLFSMLLNQLAVIEPSSFFVGLIKRHDGLLKKLSLWSFKVMNVSGFAQLEQRRCHNVVARSKIRVVPTSLSDVVTTSLSDVAKTLSKRCYNVATTLSIGFLGHFFSFIET